MHCDPGPCLKLIRNALRFSCAQPMVPPTEMRRYARGPYCDAALTADCELPLAFVLKVFARHFALVRVSTVYTLRSGCLTRALHAQFYAMSSDLTSGRAGAPVPRARCAGCLRCAASSLKNARMKPSTLASFTR